MVIWLRTADIKREKSRCCHLLYCAFQSAARVLFIHHPHRQNSTYHNLCYARCGAPAGIKNRSVDLPEWIDLMMDKIRHSTTELHPDAELLGDLMSFPMTSVCKLYVTDYSIYCQMFVGIDYRSISLPPTLHKQHKQKVIIFFF